LAAHLKQKCQDSVERNGASGLKVSRGVSGERPELCLVTGATGFIGARLCERLNLAGEQRIRAFVRSPKKAAGLVGPKIEIARGNLLDADSVARAVNGCDAVIHLAHAGGSGAAATRNMVEAASRAGVRRFVHVSSVAVDDGLLIDPHLEQASRASNASSGEDYRISKAEQEIIVRQAMAGNAFECVILRPTIVYGPKGPFVTRVLEEAATGIVTVIDGGVGLCNAIYVDDVCDAIEAAMVSRSAAGKAMIVNADRAVTWREFIVTFANFIQPPPQVKDISSVEARNWWAAHPPSPPSPPRPLLIKAVRKAVRMVSPKPPPPEFPDLGRIGRESEHAEFPNDDAKSLLYWTPRMDFAAGAVEIRKWFKSGL